MNEKNKTKTKLYTGVGDEGYTGLLGRDRVPKYNVRPEAYGTVDEASAALGIARATARDTRTADIILGPGHAARSCDPATLAAHAQHRVPGGTHRRDGGRSRAATGVHRGR